MISTLNGSSALQRFKQGNAVEIRNKLQVNARNTATVILHGVTWSNYVYLYSILWCHELTHWQNPNHNACDTNTTMNTIFTLLSQTKKISALVAHWCSDSCTSCSHLILNYSTVLVQEEQECDWQRLLLQVLWSLQHVQRDCLIVKVVWWNYLCCLYQIELL